MHPSAETSTNTSSSFSLKGTLSQFFERINIFEEMNPSQIFDDLVHGNPYSTPIGQDIDQYCKTFSQSSPNYSLLLTICDNLNNTRGPLQQQLYQDLVRAVRKKIITRADLDATLELMESVVKNCAGQGGRSFQAYVFGREVLESFVGLIFWANKQRVMQPVYVKSLSLIQSWVSAFPDNLGLRDVYEELKEKGVVFPDIDLDQNVPVVMRPLERKPKSTTASSSSPSKSPEQTQQRFPVSPSYPSLSFEQMQKLCADLAQVNVNVEVFNELMTEKSDDFEFMKELHETCKEMEGRVMALTGLDVINGELLERVLICHDGLLAVSARYETFLKRKHSPRNHQNIPEPEVSYEGRRTMNQANEASPGATVQPLSSEDFDAFLASRVNH